MPALEAQPSLPPVVPADAPQELPVNDLTVTTANVAPPDATVTKRPSWYLPDDSKVRAAAMQIMAMRISGMEDQQIADALGISVKSISPYVYRAARNGWLKLDHPKERVQYEIMHKVIDNLDEGLNSQGILTNGMRERTHVALKIAEGTVFKAFEQVQQAQGGSNAVRVNIIMPPGPMQTMRDDTIGGSPAYVDAVVVEKTHG
jgi:hypothetical protein